MAEYQSKSIQNIRNLAMNPMEAAQFYSLHAASWPLYCGIKGIQYDHPQRVQLSNKPPASRFQKAFNRKT
jgi:uncharacterized Zn-finger protein